MIKDEITFIWALTPYSEAPRFMTSDARPAAEAGVVALIARRCPGLLAKAMADPAYTAVLIECLAHLDAVAVAAHGDN